MTKATVMMAVAGLAIAGAAYADSDWTNAASGSYGNLNNWTPMDVPDTALETATISVGPGAYTVTIDSFSPALTTIEGLVLTNPAATLDIQGGRILVIAGGFLVNDGLVRIDSNNSASNSTLRFDASALLSGTGTLRLVRNTDANLQTGAGAVLTNTSRIEGGGVVSANLANAGMVEATTALTLVLNTENKTNSGIMGAAAGGLLQIDDITIANAGGLIRAVDGTVQFPPGIHRVESGNLASSGTGFAQVVSGSNLTLAGVTNTSQFRIEAGGDLFVESGMTNDGTILIDSNNGASDSRMVFTTNGTLTGSGTVRLVRNVDAKFETDPGATVTIGAAQTVSGAGQIHAALVNNGLIDSDFSGGVLEFRSNDKINNSLMRAQGGGTLNLTSVTTIQSPAGVIRADGSSIRVASGITAVDGGTIEVINGGQAFVESGANFTLADVNLSGGLNMHAGATVILETVLTNNALLVIDSNNGASDSNLTTSGDVVIDGTGTIRLARNVDANLLTGPGATLTIGAGQTINGFGHIHARLVSNGLVDADTAGGTIDFLTEPKVNNNLMRASNGGTLNISDVTTTQADNAIIRADAGTVLVTALGATRVENGTLETINGGTVRLTSSSNLSLADVDFSGAMNVESGGTLTIDTTIRNDGTILINSNNGASHTNLSTLADATITGTGIIRLGRNIDARIVNFPLGATLTMGAGQQIRGAGVIYTALVNNGLIDADVAAGVIDLRNDPKTNNNIMRATLGTLDISTVTVAQSASGAMIADGGVIRSSIASRIEHGSLSTLNGGQVAVNGSSLTLQSVTFAGLMNIAGGATVAVENILTNNGTIVVDSNNSAANAVLSVEDGGAMSGAGTVQLNRAVDAILTTPGTATFRANQTLSGLGAISGIWTFRGTIAPGFSVGTLTHTGTINMQPTAEFDLELASTASFDRLTGTGVVAIDGSLDIAFDGYTPVKNNVFRFMTGSSITGTFAEVSGPALPDGLVYGIFYDPTFVELRIVCGPDLNLDGLLDFFDVQFFLQAFASGAPEGDYNEDGLYDFFDVLAFLNDFSTSCP